MRGGSDRGPGRGARLSDLPPNWRPDDTPTLRMARSLGRLLPTPLPACVLGEYHVRTAEWWVRCTDGALLPVCELHRDGLSLSGRLAADRPIADAPPAQEWVLF